MTTQSKRASMLPTASSVDVVSQRHVNPNAKRGRYVDRSFIVWRDTVHDDNGDIIKVGDSGAYFVCELCSVKARIQHASARIMKSCHGATVCTFCDKEMSDEFRAIMVAYHRKVSECT